MFYKKTIKQILQWQKDFDEFLAERLYEEEKQNEKINKLNEETENNARTRADHEHKIEELQAEIKEINEVLKQHEETLEGLIEVLKSDRRDINAIINIVKKLDKTTTKGKK